MLEDIVLKIAPFFLLLACGYVVGRFSLKAQEVGNNMMIYAFYVAVPAMLFSSIISSKQAIGIVLLPFLFSYFSVAFLIFWSVFLLCRKFLGYSVASSSICGFGSCFSNLVLLGIPITIAIFGEAAVAPLILIVTFHALLLFTQAIVVIEIHKANLSQQKLLKRLFATPVELVKNPIILAVVLALLWRFFSLPQPPQLIWQPLGWLAASVAPVALLALGLALSDKEEKGKPRDIALMVCTKMLLLPAGVFAMTYLVFDLPATWVTVAVFVAALPIGKNTYFISQRYQELRKSSAAAVFVSTAIAPFHLTMVAYLLNSFFSN